MKLHEIKSIARRAHNSDTIEVEPAGGIYGTFKVDVEFDYEGESYTQHEPDNSSFRERHSAQVDIVSITLAEPVKEYDEDGETVVKTWPKGTDADKLPGWDKSDEKYVEDQIYDRAESSSADDYDDFDDR